MSRAVGRYAIPSVPCGCCFPYLLRSAPLHRQSIPPSPNTLPKLEVLPPGGAGSATQWISDGPSLSVVGVVMQHGNDCGLFMRKQEISRTVPSRDPLCLSSHGILSHAPVRICFSPPLPTIWQLASRPHHWLPLSSSMAKPPFAPTKANRQAHTKHTPAATHHPPKQLPNLMQSSHLVQGVAYEGPLEWAHTCERLGLPMPPIEESVRVYSDWQCVHRWSAAEQVRLTLRVESSQKKTLHLPLTIARCCLFWVGLPGSTHRTRASWCTHAPHTPHARTYRTHAHTAHTHSPHARTHHTHAHTARTLPCLNAHGSCGVFSSHAYASLAC